MRKYAIYSQISSQFELIEEGKSQAAWRRKARLEHPKEKKKAVGAGIEWGYLVFYSDSRQNLSLSSANDLPDWKLGHEKAIYPLELKESVTCGGARSYSISIGIPRGKELMSTSSPCFLLEKSLGKCPAKKRCGTWWLNRLNEQGDQWIW